jgi:hypothetical protein
VAKSVLYFLSMPTTKFVAVQLLAGFEEVRIPCHYRTGASWKDFFGKLSMLLPWIVGVGRSMTT